MFKPAEDFKVGDPVIVVESYRSTKVEATVIKVGRKYAYASAGGWQEYKFERLTGFGFSDRNSIGRDMAYSPSNYELVKEHDQAESRLKKLVGGYGWTNTLTTVQMDHIAEMIEKSN